MEIEVVGLIIYFIFIIVMITSHFIDIREQKITQREINALTKLVNEYQKDSEQSFKLLNDELNLLESNSKNQTKYNNLFTDQLIKQWVAIKLIVNEIHSRR
ncbi:hypothetical protein [Lactobacillus isalae]|uniref:hypothetical protein n=1 Tax=Lactobacillus isalae TaxID=2993455 RepID=UPI0024A9BA69|nr:hypothetical protein [Lactobacillus isalae]